ncbi:hypothetical protein Slala02_64900 [Streptomyces lavendulae subsp. lavendulae]|nr:hypothetical protein Slala02_64900 [Streptomyces lavendulae subsp. lavendulae]
MFAASGPGPGRAAVARVRASTVSAGRPMFTTRIRPVYPVPKPASVHRILSVQVGVGVQPTAGASQQISPAVFICVHSGNNE